MVAVKLLPDEPAGNEGLLHVSMEVEFALQRNAPPA